MKYYIAVDNKPLGPFEIDELIAKGITANTLVWNESMSGWLPASQVEEIVQRLENRTATPPPFNRQSGNASSTKPNVTDDVPECPKTWLVHAILCTIFCNLILGIIGIVMAAQVESRWRQGRYEEAKIKSHYAKIFVILSFITGLLASGYSGYYYYTNPGAISLF